MKLFEQPKVKKFFDILYRLDRVCEFRYKGFDKSNLNYGACQKEVFVNRTINKWLKGKQLILYVESEQTIAEYKQYISIGRISYYLGYGEEIDVMIYDYSRPVDIFNRTRLDHNKILRLEGEWCKNGDLHNALLKMIAMNLPEKEYVFKTFDFSKYPKRKKKGQTEEDIRKSLEGTISFKAMTEKGAYAEKKRFEKENAGVMVICPDILEIK